MSALPSTVIWYWGSSIVLAVLLYFPIHKLIWVLRVRRMEHKLGRSTTPEEREKERRYSRLLSGIIAITFAFLYARKLMSG